MAGVNAVISQRLKKKNGSPKMAKMAEETATGKLNTFARLFPLVELTENEKEMLEAILHEFTTGMENIETDLNSLISITSEVKAINAQAAILHGERIYNAQKILKNYNEGAFTTWLITAYGNRQTPYNFLQYYLFYEKMPKNLKPQIEVMPRQAIYTLASREGTMTKKQKIVENYQGETKSELLAIIREEFPLNQDDKRRKNYGESVIRSLLRIVSMLKSRHSKLTKGQKSEIFELLEDIQDLAENSKR